MNTRKSSIVAGIVVLVALLGALAGPALAAEPVVTPTATPGPFPARTVVDGAASAGVVYPAAIDSEIGADFRISFMGQNGNPNFDADKPAVAYNSVDNQYLVVWQGTNDTIGEYEIWGQRVNAASGAQVGSAFRISYMGTSGDADRDARVPAVAYNSQDNEYLVVWEGDHYADEEFEIWGQLVNAATGALIGGQARLSVMGPGVDPEYDAYNPDVAYNSTDNQYLVVWEGDDDDWPLIKDEVEIFGQLESASLESVGSFFRVSSMGPNRDVLYAAHHPAVAYNSTDNQYLVVWDGDTIFGDLVDNELEIWGQRLDASGSDAGLGGDFRISDVGTDGNTTLNAYAPAVAYNSADNQYLVAWDSDNSVDNEFDVFGQRLNATGGEVGANDFFLSDPGDGSNSDYDARGSAVAYDRVNNEYLAVWYDDELGVGEFEIWGQRVNAATGVEVGGDMRLSDMGPDGNADYDALYPAVACSGTSNNQYLVVWSGDEVSDAQANDEFEIFGQRLTNGYKVYLPLVLRN